MFDYLSGVDVERKWSYRSSPVVFLYDVQIMSETNCSNRENCSVRVRYDISRVINFSYLVSLSPLIPFIGPTIDGLWAGIQHLMNVLRVVPRQLHSRSGGLFGFRPAELCSFQASDFLAKSEWDEMCLLIAQESWLEEEKVQDRKDEEEKKQVEWSTRGEPKSCNLSRTFGKTKQIPGQIILIVGPPPAYCTSASGPQHIYYASSP